MSKQKILKKLMDILPSFIWNIGRDIFHAYLKYKFLYIGRPFNSGETSKAKERRMREKFFELYTKGEGLDIGYGGDPLVNGIQPFDFEHGDAQFLKGIENDKFDFVYSSHTIEHMNDPITALKNWFRVIKPGGYLLLYIPHRDLYEKKEKLPSQFNDNHRHFFLPETEELPDTIGVIPLLNRSISNFTVIYVKVCDEGYVFDSASVQSRGEYSIEVVIKKNLDS